MIRLGHDTPKKELVIKKYLSEHEIKKVYVFYFKKFKPSFNVDIEIEYIEYSDIIMYKFFYRLLEEITTNSLIIIDECMRTQNRSELTYNCTHHYLNQTPHKIIFEYFPFIEEEKDFMILLDFENKGKYKGKSFENSFLKNEDIEISQVNIQYEIRLIKTAENEKSLYENEKNKLFETLGKKDPDTIPRNLHIFTGKLKKAHLKDYIQYISRNKRFSLANVGTYKDSTVANCTIIDFPCRRLELLDYIKNTKTDKITFMSTDLSVDVHYDTEFKDWMRRLNDFYVKSGV